MAIVNQCSAVLPLTQILSLVYWLILVSPLVGSYDYEKDVMAPVILVPGIAGSQIRGKWHTHGHATYCQEKSTNGWNMLWVDLGITVGGRPLKCWAFRFLLRYNRTTHRCSNQNGVRTHVTGKFGSLKPVEFLSRNVLAKHLTGYYHKVIKALKKRGYSSDNSLKAAGYDWRYAPVQQEEFGYFTQLTTLVESVAADTKRKVAIVAHSMGGLMMAYFLTNKTQEWKDKHIQVLITVSTPWLGSPQSIETYLIGTTYDLPTLSAGTMRWIGRTFQSVAFLMPYEEEFKNVTLVEYPPKNKKYTANDYEELFRDMGVEDGYLMRQDLRSLFPVQIDKLGVRMFCIWANKSRIETVIRYQVQEDFDHAKTATTFFTEGDGTVPLRSLRYCEKFKGVTVKIFQGYGHTEIVHKGSFIDHMMSLITNAQAFKQ